MSGVEIVGILLGAFPLIISAMEHYEKEKRVVGTFWRIRKSHRKDLGKVKDCQLKFKLNMKELLLPLLLDEVVDRVEYEQLLADPGGQGWKEEGVNESLASRLSESHERYLEVLEELAETLGKLSKAVKVDDPQFQALLAAKNPVTTAKQEAQRTLMAQANMRFQAKRVKYSFTGTARDNLLEEVEKYNQTLESLLAANDRVSALAQGPGRPSNRRITSKILQYWRHADRIFSLIRESFECRCRHMHCANLWLAHRPGGAIDMNLMLKFSQAKIASDPPWERQSMQIKLAGKQSQMSTDSNTPNPGSKAPSILFQSAPSSASASTMSLKTASFKVNSPTVTTTLQLSTASFHTVAASNDLKQMGLCKTVCHSNSGSCIGALIDDDNDNNYTVLSAAEVTTEESISLAEALTKPFRMTRAQRYQIALALASSHLQLHSTPWLKEEWTAQDVRLPISSSRSGKVLHNQPYLLAHFESLNFSKAQKDRSFATLGVVLLELCFGVLLEEHPLWHQPGFSQGRASPIIQQAVASEWLEDVPGEAGPDYAAAIEWTLRSAPAISVGIKDEKWRSEFASNVLEPLQRCFESMKPMQP